MSETLGKLRNRPDTDVTVSLGSFIALLETAAKPSNPTNSTTESEQDKL